MVRICLDSKPPEPFRQLQGLFLPFSLLPPNLQPYGPSPGWNVDNVSTLCFALDQISLLPDTLRMNAVSHIQALAQTGKWLEEMALKIREGLDLVKAEDTACLPSSLCSAMSSGRTLQETLCIFPRHEGLTPSPRNSEQQKSNRQSKYRSRKKTLWAAGPWSASMRFQHTPRTDLTMQQCAQPPPAGVQHAFWHCAPYPHSVRAVLGLSSHIHFTFERAAGEACCHRCYLH